MITCHDDCMEVIANGNKNDRSLNTVDAFRWDKDQDVRRLKFSCYSYLRILKDDFKNEGEV